ncbi:cupin 4 [Candidatus Protofrankia californiensis]|uniref:Cupin 4 n=1 Tax=Candidatus Protofrankia californiensis TaxID=1839754 RepID=A0A1C3P4S0_9ACTN|nr:cupin 4 [Candidatus Protofrankia californiensis]
MDHRLVRGVEKALGWAGPSMLGSEFTRGGTLGPDLCARLLTPTKLLDLVMRRSLASPQLRCFRDGSELHPNSYISATTTKRGQGIHVPSMRRLGRLIESGCTLVLDSLEVFDPTMEVACRALQWWSRELVQVNAYLTTHEADGFNLHWDDHDVLVVQLAGEKSWEVRGSSRSAPMYRDAEQNQTPSDDLLWSGTLCAGEVMHIPRGYWHQATRSGHGAGFSLHVTFGFVKRTGVDWLTWLADEVRESEVFRHDLDRWGTLEERVLQETELATIAANLAGSRPPSEFLAAREEERPAHRHVATGGTFGNPTSVVCVTEFPPRFEKHNGRIDVFAAGKKITFAAGALPALEKLLSGSPAIIDEVAATTGLDVAQLANVLIQEEICAELIPELSLGYTDLITSGNCSKKP